MGRDFHEDGSRWRIMCDYSSDHGHIRRADLRAEVRGLIVEILHHRASVAKHKQNPRRVFAL